MRKVTPFARCSRETCTSVGPERIGAPSSCLSDSEVRKRHEEVSLNTTVECAPEARATWRQVSRRVSGRPQLTSMRWYFEDNSNERQPACASWLIASGGGASVSTITRL